MAPIEQRVAATYWRPNMKSPAELQKDFIADFRSQIADLQALQATAPSGYVVKVGPLWIAFNGPGYTKPSATSAMGASVFLSNGEAYRVGKLVQNGGGERGKVQMRWEAIAEQIESLEASIAFLESAKI